MTGKKIIGFFKNKLHIWTFALTVFFTINMNYDWRTVHIVWYGCLAFLVFSYMITFQGKFLFSNSPFLTWICSFLLLCVCSFLWCLSLSTGLDVVKSLVVIIAVLLLVQSSINYGFKLETVLRGYFVSTLINAIYIVVNIDMTKLGITQIGVELINGWNGNGIGFMMAQGALIGCYLLHKCQTLRSKIVYLVSVVAFSLLTVYTGSRTAFIVLVVELVLYFWMRYPTKIMRNIVILLIAFFVAVILIMNVEGFYNVLGSRLEDLFEVLSGSGEGDGSSNIRLEFIRNGIEWFAEKPVLGYGINNYKVLNESATGNFTYAHNNFVEIAVNLGVIGLILYYSVYVHIIRKMLRSVKNNPRCAFLFSAIVATLLSHYGTVSYYDFYENLLILMCFIEISKGRKGVIESDEWNDKKNCVDVV